MDDLILISQRFFPGKKQPKIEKLTGGLIHKTFKISFSNHEAYILQSINDLVFKDPNGLMNNISLIANHLKSKNYPLKILEPIASPNGFLEKDQYGNYWRAFPFYRNSLVLEKVTNPKHVFEAAKAFGLFLKFLDGIDLKNIKETIPKFHNLDHRLMHFEQAINNAKKETKSTAKEAIETILKWKEQFKFDFSKMPLRIVHNDTKISNVLLSKANMEGICVIDLDTVMPGYLVTDFGDMIRTMCCTASEEETDLDKIAIDINIFTGMTEGFLFATRSFLKKVEKENLVIGGVFIIFEQAMRFLTDYLQENIYYPVSFPEQNLIRSKNQIKLLTSLLDNQTKLDLIVNKLY